MENEIITESSGEEPSLIKKICELHDNILNHLRRSLDDAIRIGELLTQQKEEVGHGRFTVWIRENLPFSDRTARTYMSLFRRRETLKTEDISILKLPGHQCAIPNGDSRLSENTKPARMKFDCDQEGMTKLKEYLSTKASEYSGGSITVIIKPPPR